MQDWWLPAVAWRAPCDRGHCGGSGGARAHGRLGGLLRQTRCSSRRQLPGAVVMQPRLAAAAAVVHSCRTAATGGGVEGRPRRRGGRCQWWCRRRGERPVMARGCRVPNGLSPRSRRPRQVTAAQSMADVRAPAGVCCSSSCAEMLACMQPPLLPVASAQVSIGGSCSGCCRCRRRTCRRAGSSGSALTWCDAVCCSCCSG